jgi:transcriptional regulator with GAF, ATPase, and Fis domain
VAAVAGPADAARAGPATDRRRRGRRRGHAHRPDPPLPPSPGAARRHEPPDGERERLIWAMEQCGWVQAKAARLLRVTPRQLGYALQKNRIEVRKF